MHTVRSVVFLLLVLSLLSCQAGKDGAVEGTVDPPGSQARITANSGGRDVRTAPPEQDGTFRLVLAAGTYTITVTEPGSSFPLRFEGIVVRPGETTTLPPILLSATAVTASLSGRVVPSRQGSEVKLLYEGRERAAVRTDSEGRYEFKEVHAGTYEVLASLPGYAEDRSPVAVAGNRNAEHTAVLLPITEIDGVDWVRGMIRARGIGLPPQGVANPAVRHAMAERAALADGRRNLLRTVGRIRLNSGRDVRTTMQNPGFAERIQGFVKGYTVAGKREQEDGKIEIILELPLTGPNGLSRIAESSEP